MTTTTTIRISDAALQIMQSVPRVGLLAAAETMRAAGDGRASEADYRRAESRLEVWGLGFNGLDLYTI